MFSNLWPPRLLLSTEGSSAPLMSSPSWAPFASLTSGAGIPLTSGAASALLSVGYLSLPSSGYNREIRTWWNLTSKLKIYVNKFTGLLEFENQNRFNLIKINLTYIIKIIFVQVVHILSMKWEQVCTLTNLVEIKVQSNIMVQFDCWLVRRFRENFNTWFTLLVLLTTWKRLKLCLCNLGWLRSSKSIDNLCHFFLRGLGNCRQILVF